MDVASPDAELSRVVTQLVAVELEASGRSKVLSTVDVRQVLALEEQKQLAGCDEASCLAEIAGALGAEEVVFGDIVLLDERFLLTLNLLDVRANESKGRAVVEVQGRDRLPTAVKRGVAQLTGIPVAAEGPDLLLWSGVGTSLVGAAAATGGVLAALWGDSVRSDAQSSGSSKDAGAVAQLVGGGAFVIGAITLTAGAALTGVALLSE